jgi:RNA polymerase sigma-70 factor (ECF subfamily)
VKVEDAQAEIRKPGDPSQLELVRAGKCRDASAFAELVRRNQRRAFSIAYKITRNREDAEDAVQESFIKAYEKLSGFEERASFSTWITRIVLNAALTILRHRSRLFEELRVDATNAEAPPSFDFPDHGMNPEQACLNFELRSRIHLCLQQMKSNRQVFVLRDVEGFSTSETAQALNLTRSAVKSKLMRARRLAKKKLSIMRTGLRNSRHEISGNLYDRETINRYRSSLSVLRAARSSKGERWPDKP